MLVLVEGLHDHRVVHRCCLRLREQDGILVIAGLGWSEGIDSEPRCAAVMRKNYVATGFDVGFHVEDRVFGEVRVVDDGE